MVKVLLLTFQKKRKHNIRQVTEKDWQHLQHSTLIEVKLKQSYRIARAIENRYAKEKKEANEIFCCNLDSHMYFRISFCDLNVEHA